MKYARASLIVAYGLFTIAAQTLLFREFLTAFEGNDISVGVFFGSWLLWVGVGACVVRRWGRLAEFLSRHTTALFLAYIPALAVQLLLITRVRELAGVASYDLMSVQAIVFWSLLVNAPLSFVTGLLFPLACRWIEQTQAFPVSYVYVLEAAGSFLGGIAVTVLLALHVDAVRILFLIAVALSLSVLWVQLVQPPARLRRSLMPSLLVLLPILCLASGIDSVLAQRLRLLKWSRLLPPDAYRGVLHTAQAEYLYGQYRDQWVVIRDGAACETLPDLEAAGQTAAISLCQNPDAKRILVVGSGLALCERLLSLPQIERVAWAHADSEYVAHVQEHVPPSLRISDARFHPVAQELRQYLGSEAERFDLVILHLPGTAGSAFNRYFTVECFERIKASLAPGGVLSVSVAGGENVMGAELAGLGASVRRTLGGIFSHIVIVPGDETWLLASDSPALTGDPAALRDRFAGIEGAERIFPPAGLLSIYLPDRARQALARYDKVDLPEDLLVNHDARPLTHLYSLLLVARQSGASVTRFVKLLALGGLLPFLAPILVFVFLRVWAVAESTDERASSFDSSFLVFSTGWVGIAVVIVLMYLYETRFGSLYLHVGLISSLFMAGLTAGAILTGRLIRRGGSLQWLLPGSILFHALVLAAVALWLGERQVGHGPFAAAFVLSGLCCGAYWPLAAARLAAAGFQPGQAGSRLETADHLGACIGGLAASLLMVPVLGTRATLLVLIGLLLANLPASLAVLWRREQQAGVPRLRYAGYALFGVAACIVVVSNTLAAAQMRRQPTLPEHVVQTLAGEQTAREVTTTLTQNDKRVRYFVLSFADEPTSGYVVSTADFAPAVRGFGGRINLAVRIDNQGGLVDLLIVQSNETPAYFDLLQGWLGRLKGRRLFTSQPFVGIDTVTGATISSQAVLDALRESSREFASQILGKGLDQPSQIRSPQSVIRSWRPAPAAVYLVVVVTAAILVMLRGAFPSRLAVLVLTLVVGGIVLNAQYSMEQIVSLLSLDVPAARLSGVFLLVVGVPLLVLLLGNLYCGYVCPFGAAQELLGYVLPKRFKPADPAAQMRAARLVRYAVLFVLIAAFFLSRSRTTVSVDPLISVFHLPSSVHSAVADRSTRVWIIVALVGSLFVVRFWCRFLCPVGAFLSLLNRVALFRRRLPARWFARCEFGLTAQERPDCIYCDRCRYPVPGEVQIRQVEAHNSAAAYLWPVVVTVAVLMAVVSIRDFRRAMPTMLDNSAAAASVAGEPRDVDLPRMRALIEQGRLSDQEARHYKKLDEPQPMRQSSGSQQR